MEKILLNTVTHKLEFKIFQFFTIINTRCHCCTQNKFPDYGKFYLYKYRFLEVSPCFEAFKYNYKFLFQYLKLLKKKKYCKKSKKLLGTCMNNPPEMYFNFCYNLLTYFGLVKIFNWFIVLLFFFFGMLLSLLVDVFNDYTITMKSIIIIMPVFYLKDLIK